MNRLRCRALIALCTLAVMPVVALANDALRQRVEALQAGYVAQASGEPLLARIALSRFYSQRNYSLAWTRAEDRDAYQATLISVAAEGFNPADYHFQALRRFEQLGSEGLSAAEQVDRDLLLTDSFLLLASHMLEGKVNPETIDAEWLANRRQRLIEPLLQAALANARIADTLQQLRPQQAGYRRLLLARAQVEALIGQPWPKLPPGAALKPSLHDPRVSLLRERLSLLGDYVAAHADAEMQDEPDYYDENLAAAVRAFQRRHGLEADGVVGTATLNALNVTPEKRLKQIDVNLERWRWLPDELGETHILVNIAGFDLSVVHRETVEKRYRVIVGRPFRRTPVFSDRIRYIVFNPTWTVPKKLLIEDKIPEIIRDPSYISRLGFKVYRGWGADRTEVVPESVDWRALSRRNLPYQLVQAPGPQNAMGQVKFMFPNKFDVYLHDTPARELFDETERSFSSGCIRVESPLDLAQMLLQDSPDWNRERINRVIQEQNLTTVYLKTPMPVHLQYWTAWVDEEGRLQFRKDLYQRDLRLMQALNSHAAPTSP